MPDKSISQEVTPFSSCEELPFTPQSSFPQNFYLCLANLVSLICVFNLLSRVISELAVMRSQTPAEAVIYVRRSGAWFRFRLAGWLCSSEVYFFRWSFWIAVCAVSEVNA